ncbi:NADH:flavin oxidoreductase/NADH oxidase [Variovorax sp. J22R133]|uniref:NADH:flavin oxidoreductase/NADH oxidase n=1 Tax=Variovorax brevis TaxID=3053503 RepID=UPI002577690A|nr:NADH:flavin oxidoreductase/NADH oxidase [Variovorax sp. J22R133]MDM0116109.1 NADH:flavin oxidoreductase/NADH oxidase [Variovorax sp. J22R133]
MTAIFRPLSLRNMTLKNRIVMSPMLMYAGTDDGLFSDLHFAHYAARLLGGVGMVMTEVIAVEPRGRISHKDLGLWNDAQIEGLSRLTAFARRCGAAAGIQLAHAGRKAQLESEIVAPSSIAYDEKSKLPRELRIDEIEAIIQNYADAAKRADQAGFDCIELHAAHGYLMHEFLAPMSNQRMDRYGGDIEGRARFVLETTRAVRAVWPIGKPLIVRITATDLREGGVTVEEAHWLAMQLKELGVDLLEVSSGNIVPGYSAPVYPGYHLPYAAALKAVTGLPVGAMGSITSSDHAEAILASGTADLVFLGRELLRNPFWVIQAAQRAKVEIELPIPTYGRATGPYERGF